MLVNNACQINFTKHPFLKPSLQPKTLFRAVKEIGIGLVELFYPRLCVHCQEALYSSEDFLCLHCWEKILWIPKQHLWNNLDFKIYAQAYYMENNPIQSILHHIKYKKNKVLAYKMSECMSTLLKETNRPWDFIVPVPMHPKKKKQRGFNQAQVLAEAISRDLSIPILGEETIIKVTQTHSQTKKGKKDRWTINQTMYTITQREKIHGSRILVIDDVYTTGATFYHLEKQLRETGAKSIDLAVLGFTQKC